MRNPIRTAFRSLGATSLACAAGATFLVLAPGATSVLGATRTVCFDVKFADNRTDCANVGETSARRPCDPGNDIWTVGHRFEAWDRDDDGNDELISTFTIGGEGTRCLTFEWENASYSKGEANPDVYLEYINEVRKTSKTGAIVTAVDTGGGAHPNTTWRDSAVAENCTAAADCDIMASGYMIPTNDESSERGLRIQALDSSQHALEVFGDLLEHDVDMHFPGSDPTVSFADNEKNYHIDDFDGGDTGVVPPHELGHIVQMQLFNRDSLRDECGASHSLDSIETNSCATTEGWADYVGVVSWYDPNSNGVIPLGWGFDFEESDPEKATCSTNADVELQVAKAFWDFDDWDNEAGSGAAAGDDDDMSFATDDIAEGWLEFDSGTANRKDHESGADGVNARDYFHNNNPRIVHANFFETFIDHNCLGAQDDN